MGGEGGLAARPPPRAGGGPLFRIFLRVDAEAALAAAGGVGGGWADAPAADAQIKPRLTRRR